jgi:hypothetical protein
MLHLYFFIIALEINRILGLSMISDQPLRILKIRELVVSGMTQKISGLAD